MKTDLSYEKLIQRVTFLSGFAILLFGLLLPARAAGQVASVQVASSDAVLINRSTVAVPFTSAQAAGNLNVVVVAWNDTSSSITSVTDSNGNTYVLAATTEATAVPAPPGLKGVSQVIYYAANIKAGANTVTVTFNQTTAAQSIRMVEYVGLDTAHPLDTAAANAGSTVPADSGAVTTNSANDLLFGAGAITSGFTGSGTGFSTVLLNGFGDIVEDQFVNAVGSYNATATFGAGSWVMQLVAFRAALQLPPTFGAPTISSLSVSSAPEVGGAPLTLTGTNFESGAAVLFSSNPPGTTAAGVNCTVTSVTTIACLTPSFPFPGGAANITVSNVDGQASAPFVFTFTASTPFLTAVSPSITPDTGSTNGGTVVIISGSEFAAGATVTVGGLLADRIAVLNVNTILASLPAGEAGLKPVVVTNPSGTAGTLPGGYTYAPGTGINFVQVNSAQPVSPATTASVTYPLAQSAADLNVVVVGWADPTSTVQSVVDSAGNTYTLAFAPTVGNGLSQAIYFAKNILASVSNTVTVTFNVAAASPNVRILEYSGADTVSPLDDTSGQFSTGTLLDSGTVFTTVAGDLVIGASMSGGTVVTTRPTYTTVTHTIPGGISVEHVAGVANVPIRATATQDSSAPWVMQAVGFKQAVAVADFTVGVTPPSTATVAAGSSATYTISVAAVNGFNSIVTLSCSGLPLGTSCGFNPPTVTPGATAVTSVLTLTTTAATPPATTVVTVTGTFGSLSHDATVSLTVTADFAIAATALAPASVVAGASATSTVTITPTSGFTGTVDLSCANILPAGTNDPSCSFNPASLTFPGSADTSTLTVSTVAITSPAAYTLAITGTSGSLNHSAQGALTVTAPAADFTIAASALAPATVAAGASSTSTITIAPAAGSGFNSAVALTCGVTPTVTRAPTCAFNPASVPNGSGTSTLTVSTTAATTASVAPHSRGLFYAMLLPIGGLAFLGTGLTSRKKKLWSFLFGCLLFSALIILPACGGSGSSGGGGHPGTPAGTYTATVTATSGSLTHTATATLIVQ